jgi:hypothetical protein
MLLEIFCYFISFKSLYGDKISKNFISENWGTSDNDNDELILTIMKINVNMAGKR